MILAKLSGMPIREQISKVTTAAINSGTSVNRTSLNRRSTTHNRTAIERSANMAASTKAPTTVLPASRIVIGPSVALGSTASTALAKWRIAALSLGFPLGAIETRARPSDVIQSLTSSGGRVSSVIGRACSEFPHCGQILSQR